VAVGSVTQRLELRLTEILVDQGVITLNLVLEAIREAGKTGETLIDVLLRFGSLTKEQLTEASERVALESEYTLAFLPSDGEHPAFERDVTQRSEETASPEDAAELDGLGMRARYRDGGLLGQGGMAVVTLAYDKLLNRQVALKALPPGPHVARSSGRLLEEARITGLLDHPGIVPVYDVGGDDGCVSFYTMRVVALPTFSEQLLQSSESRHDQAVAALRQVCLTVHFAHDRGVIHRDLKPDNILLGEYGEVYVVDWGMAQVIDETLGLNRSPHEPQGFIVGTLRYMSPEQARGDHGEVDVRSDIFALGGLLYYALTLTAPHQETGLMELRHAVLESVPQAPEERAPERGVPLELSEICLKALAKDPSDRYQTAKDMAEDLARYLAGEKQRARRVEQALEYLRQGTSARERWAALRVEFTSVRQACRRLQDVLVPWAPASEKASLWAAQTEAEHVEVNAERAFAEAVRFHGEALAHDPSLYEASRALTELYWWRLEQAEAMGRTTEAVAWESLVEQHGDRATRRRLHAGGSIALETEPAGFTAELHRYEERDRHLVAAPVSKLGLTPLRCEGLAPGSYLISVTCDGFAPMKLPVQVRRDTRAEVRAHGVAVDALPEGWCVVSAGEYRTGQTPDAESLDLDTFAIKRHPVTCGEYLAFLNDVASSDPERARRHAPRIHEAAPSYFEVDEAGGYSLPARDAEGDAWFPDWPIILVNHDDSLAYAAWLSERDGRTYRLPTSAEWQKAARGSDGRPYPWGQHFDATFCHMRDSAEGRPVPSPVGSHPVDCSPYGVLDMAGNVVEWTSTVPSSQVKPSVDETDFVPSRVLEGASYNSAEFVCSLDFNMSSPLIFRHGHYGFRLAITLAG
jgi:eukaryotic-like serine/threonine-protein kinase